MDRQELIDSLLRDIRAVEELQRQLQDRSTEICQITEAIYAELWMQDDRGIQLFEETREDAYQLCRALGEMREYLEQLWRKVYFTETPPQPPEDMES